MITAVQFCEHLKINGFDFFVSVPCSLFKNVIRHLENDALVTYVPAVREDTAVGMAAGACLAGRCPMVLIQNSGLGVCLNSLGSLAIIYKLPILFLISWRGYQGMDAPEHFIMGQAMLGIMQNIGMPYQVLEQNNVSSAIGNAVSEMDKTHLPYGLILREGILG